MKIFVKIFEWFKEAVGEIWDFVEDFKGGILLIGVILPLVVIILMVFFSTVADRECERHPDSRGCAELQMQKTYGPLDAPLTKRDALIMLQELKRECGTDYRNGDFK